MFSFFQLGIKYVNYLATASNGKGHGIHSPFVFEFITKVLNGYKDTELYSPIENVRKQLLQNSAVLPVEDFGAGSRVIATRQRTIKSIANTSLKPKKYSQLLHRMVKFYKPATIVEIGTSLGITTSYIATANAAASVTTMEGAATIAAVA
jgi:hypothetical protein